MITKYCQRFHLSAPATKSLGGRWETTDKGTMFPRSSVFRVVLVLSLCGVALHYLINTITTTKVPAYYLGGHDDDGGGDNNNKTTTYRRTLRETKVYNKPLLWQTLSEGKSKKTEDTTRCSCACQLHTGKEGRAMISLDPELVTLLGGHAYLCIPDHESDILLSRGMGKCDDSCT